MKFGVRLSERFLTFMPMMRHSEEQMASMLLNFMQEKGMVHSVSG